MDSSANTITMKTYKNICSENFPRSYGFQEKFSNNKKIKTWKTILKDFFNRSSIHGLKYLQDEEISYSGRFFWILAIIACIFGAVHLCFFVWEKYVTIYTKTILENPIYPVSQIPFPAISICNYNRINWKKMNGTIDKYGPKNSSFEVRKLLEEFLIYFEDFNLKRIQKFKDFRNKNLTSLDTVILDQALLNLSFDCEEFFESCRINRKIIDCCKIFRKQKSSLGICFIFNSIISDTGKRFKNETTKLQSVFSYGSGSGLVIKMKLDPSTKNPNNRNHDGVSVMLLQEMSYPRNEFFLESNAYHHIIAKPKLFTIKPETKLLPVSVRYCVFPDEVHEKYYHTLPGYEYDNNNCYGECDRQLIIKSCNCSPTFIYPDDDPPKFRKCVPSDFLCLSQLQEKFVPQVSPMEENYVNNFGQGNVCDCHFNCNFRKTEHKARTEELSKEHGLSDNHMILDIYYRRLILFKFNTFLSYNWVDFIVHMGGGIAFFLGCSVISLIEILFYIFVIILNELQQKYNLTVQSNGSGRSWTTALKNLIKRDDQIQVLQ